MNPKNVLWFFPYLLISEILNRLKKKGKERQRRLSIERYQNHDMNHSCDVHQEQHESLSSRRLYVERRSTLDGKMKADEKRP
jgi:hypothetical protein